MSLVAEAFPLPMTTGAGARSVRRPLIPAAAYLPSHLRLDDSLGTLGAVRFACHSKSRRSKRIGRSGEWLSTQAALHRTSRSSQGRFVGLGTPPCARSGLEAGTPCGIRRLWGRMGGRIPTGDGRPGCLPRRGFARIAVVGRPTLVARFRGHRRGRDLLLRPRRRRLRRARDLSSHDPASVGRGLRRLGILQLGLYIASPCS